jgi:type IV fimbrial biogenesis protein FimT
MMTLRNRKTASRGFTMVELMVVVALGAIITTLAAPSFNEQIARRRLEGAATELSIDLQYARTQAVSERNTVQLVTENGGTSYRIVNGAGITLKTVNLPSGVTVTNAVTVNYQHLRGNANVVQIALANVRTTAGMRVDTNTMGRVSICSPNAALKGYVACS